jgi:TRAP-type C4-dicarboxylate transport system substrate-binding protein
MCAPSGARSVTVMLRTRLTIALASASLALTGCFSGGGDKAGGSDAPVVLRLATADNQTRPEVEQPDFFAHEVERLSHGQLRVEVVRDVVGEKFPDTEGRVADLVRDGRYQLGWIGARAWDTRGVDAFQAIQAPFLITDKGLLDEVVAGDIGKAMLARLHGDGVEGIALVPGLLRHPFGLRHPFTSPRDFRGATVRVTPSNASDALMRALGATPAHVASDSIGQASRNGAVDAREQSLGADPVGRWLTANLTFFGKAITLFGNGAALGKLTGEQRDILRRAGDLAVKHAIAAAPVDAELALDYCTAARVVTAPDRDLAALRRKSAPVYAQMERDPGTREAIAAIRALKAQLPPRAPVEVPASCSEPPSQQELPARDPKPFDGTYRWRLTREGAARAGTTADPDDNFGDVNTMTLRDGHWLLGGADLDHGTFEVRGDRIVFDWPRVDSVLTFTFVRHDDGTLDITPVLPMDQGDQYVWASGPWRRVGPPVRTIPAP